MHFYRKCWFDPSEKQFISPFLSDCPSLIIGIAIHCIQHSQAMLERRVCELAHSFFHFLSVWSEWVVGSVLSRAELDSFLYIWYYTVRTQSGLIPCNNLNSGDWIRLIKWRFAFHFWLLCKSFQNPSHMPSKATRAFALQAEGWVLKS